MKFDGIYTPVITPHGDDGSIDRDALAAQIEHLIASGVHGLINGGSTGEYYAQSMGERKDIATFAKDVIGGRVPLIVGTVSVRTDDSIMMAEHAAKIGADALLVVTPYYNKPTQTGLLHHFRAIHDATGLPIIIYNIPGRSVINMSVETMAELSKLERIVGVKDATADLVRPIDQRLASGPDFIQMSGEDASILPFMGAGGHGCISVTSNVAPRLCADFHAAWAAGDRVKAQEINDRLMPLHHALFIESNPVPAKYALELLGMVEPGLRLPLVPLQQSTKDAIKAALIKVGLL